MLSAGIGPRGASSIFGGQRRFERAALEVADEKIRTIVTFRRVSLNEVTREPLRYHFSKYARSYFFGVKAKG